MVSILPPDWSVVKKPKPVTKAVERGFLKPEILNETSVPPFMSLEAKFEMVRTEFENEHYKFDCRTAVFMELQLMAP